METEGREGNKLMEFLGGDFSWPRVGRKEGKLTCEELEEGGTWNNVNGTTMEPAKLSKSLIRDWRGCQKPSIHLWSFFFF